MKKLLLPLAAAALLGACSTATLININVDGDSFIDATTKTISLPAVPPITPQVVVIPDGGAGLPLQLPTLTFLTGIRLNIGVSVVATDPTAGATGTIEMFVAQSSTANLYDPANKVPTAANCVGDATLTEAINLNLTATSPAACAAAFNLMKAGNFKIGARASFNLVNASPVTVTLTNLDVGVSGYPAKLLPL